MPMEMHGSMDPETGLPRAGVPRLTGRRAGAIAKTPTPTAYDVPRSPNNPLLVPATHLDLLDLNPVDALHMDANRDAPAVATRTGQRQMLDEEQQLATKLKETYKNIVNYEETVQKSCIDITLKMQRGGAGFGPGLAAQSASKTSELSNDLWTAYHHNLVLLDNYYDFLVTALKPLLNQTQFKTGKNIVDLYKIPRRLWVYGIVGFLEVLKNIMNIFQDHEICLCFISYCFNIVSNLTDPSLEMEGWWCEKLGDLLRMAIALYLLRFIDWKILAEYWYALAMRTLYGHGKIYYHMCTVQQDNLDALVNIGKLVFCRDPFVPTHQYLRLVVENICTQRNILLLLELPIIDFIKIHKVLLSIYNTPPADPANPDSIRDTQVQYGIDLVTRYGLTFGSDSNGYNFFTRGLYTPPGASGDGYYVQQLAGGGSSTMEKMNFWFNKGQLFAIANLNHLVGFGDARNPFAKIFGLPEALKERKDKKDKKRKSRGTDDLDTGPVDGHSAAAADLAVDDWFYCLAYINKLVLELSMSILNHYLVGPKQALTGHVLVWMYFLVAVGEATSKYPNLQNMFYWLFRKVFPWDALIRYLNTLVAASQTNAGLRQRCRSYLVDHDDYMAHFAQHEFLPEVWKCWGTLWFDCIASKADYTGVEAAGVVDSGLFDMPVCGTSPAFNASDKPGQLEHHNDERIVRIVLLARHFADTYGFGLIRTASGFKFDRTVFHDTDVLVGQDPHAAAVPYGCIEEFLFSDSRLVKNNFMVPIAPENLAAPETVSSGSRDHQWYQTAPAQSGPVALGDEIVAEEDLEGYADLEFDDDDAAFEPQRHHLFHQHHHQQALLHGGHMTDEWEAEAGPDAVLGDLGDRMDTAVTCITLDTNIWLKHCGRVFKCIRSGIFHILIPLIVFQELRLLRKLAEATIADAATRSVIIIRELYLAREILPLRFDGSVASDINETAEFENNSNWRTSVDETILNAVHEHDEVGRRTGRGAGVRVHPAGAEGTVLGAKNARMFRYCVLITDDRNMRLRAKTIGLTSFQSKWLFAQLETAFADRCID